MLGLLNKLHVVQKWLLCESKLTFERAVEIAPGVKLVDQQMKTMKSGDSIIKRVQPQPTLRLPCYGLGKDNHTSNKCRYKNVTCNGCGKWGHVLAVCRRKRTETQSIVKPYRRKRDKVNGQTNRLQGILKWSTQKSLLRIIIRITN